jgi:hypothetical protein
MSIPAKRIASMSDLDDEAICYWRDEYGGWWLYLPGCGTGRLSLHTVTEHKDGTISVTPSIKMVGHLDKVYHGYLTAGVWNDA